MERIWSFILAVLSFWNMLFLPANRRQDTALLSDAFVSAFTQKKMNLFSVSDTDPAVILRHTEQTEDGICISGYRYQTNFRAETVHLSRTLCLALRYRQSSDEEEQKELSAVVDGLVRYYAQKDFQSSNWWYNQIFTPNCLAEVLLLMGSAVSETTKEQAMPLIERGVFAKNPEAEKATGANLLWFGECTLKYCALTGDGEGLKTAVARITEELQYKDAEGIRTDGSFFQHKERLYTGGYGGAFAESVAMILYVLKDTSVCPTKKELLPYGELLVKGLRLVTVGKHLDYNTVGREIARSNALSAEGLVPYLRLLLYVRNMPCKMKIWQYMRSIEKDTYVPTGLHYFDQAHMLVLRCKDFYFSFRGVGEKLYYAETLNGENFLSYNLSYGNTTALMRTGREYENINPVWDYALIPGTTAVYENDEALKQHTNYSARRMHAIGGGMADGDKGVCFSKSNHEGISATVACFACGDSVVLLGAGLRNEENLPMVTTVEQCFQNGKVVQEGNAVIHNGIRYTGLSGTLVPKTETRTGSWQRNRASSSADPVTGDVFTLIMEGGESYAYAISGERNTPEYKIVRNDTGVQAILTPDGTLMAVFYRDSSFTWNGTTYEGKKEEALMQKVSS